MTTVIVIIVIVWIVVELLVTLKAIRQDTDTRNELKLITSVGVYPEAIFIWVLHIVGWPFLLLMLRELEQTEKDSEQDPKT